MRQFDSLFDKQQVLNSKKSMESEPIKIHQQNAKNPLLPPKFQDIHQFEVICRVRPLADDEHVSDISINEEKSTITIVSQVKNLTKQFIFNKIYNENITQQKFSQELSDKIFRYCRHTGKTALIFSYGVTNSGKTYSILGTEEKPGLLPSIIQKIETEFPQDHIRISAIQIYNDEFYSLKNKQKLCPRQRGAFYQFDEYQPQEITKESTSEMMRQYMVNRYQADTKSNKKSSRSHAIFKIETDQISIAIIDLAGSERINKAQTNAQETASINLSLLTLGKCIHAIRDRVSIPFRESKLTRAIVQYFTPQSKIYMIAHINRSGEMFHENVNVLQYAAISTQVKQFNPRFNYSIVKSAHKKIEKSKSKSILKEKENSPKNNQDGKKQKVPKSAKLHKENKGNDLNAKLVRFDQKNKEEYKKDKNRVMESYINRLKAKKEEFDFYLDCEFEKQDSKDLQFIQELKKARYVSPQKSVEINIQLVKAESRIKLRKQILEQIERQKLNNQSDAFTEMGPSMRKCLQQSILKQRSQKQAKDSCEVKLNLDQAQPITKSDQRVKEELLKFQSTPNKEEKTGDQEKANYLGKLWQKSKKILNSAGQAFNNVVVEYIRSHSQKKQKPIERKKLAIQKQIQIYIQKQRQSQKHIQARYLEQGTMRPKELQSLPQNQNERVNQTLEQSHRQEVSCTYSDLLKGLQTQSTVSEQPSLLFVNLSKEYQISAEGDRNLKQIRQSQEFKAETNSPYFKNTRQQFYEAKQSHQQITMVNKPIQFAQQKSIESTQITFCQKVSKNNNKIKMEVSLEQTVSGSDWDQQTSKGSSVFSQKNKNNAKGKNRGNRELKFYVQQPNKKKSISPLKTRSQKLKMSQLRSKI